MIKWTYLVCVICVVLVEVVLGTYLDPQCPRHRGLPDGFTRSENRYRHRALYRIDLRNAIKGFVPGKEYKFRVQTTNRKSKFNDATLVTDAIDEQCGAGSWVTNTSELYSPKNCPSIVTTQQKEPMGRAYFKWMAPPCGCVHIRARVHANSTYFIEDETVRNGPLARTICPKPGTVTQPVTSEFTTTVMPEALTRNERLKLLCDVTNANKAEDVMKNEDFLSRRTMSKLNSFEIQRLNIAVEQRHLEIVTCCGLDTEFNRTECFGDIRRVRIDTFCGNGEPDIPLTQTRYDWIKQKQPECCPQIGEDRYRCFNYTLHEDEMLKDSHGQHSSMDMDEFDPVNYVEDYPKADEIKMKFSKEQKQTSKALDPTESTKTTTEGQNNTLKGTEQPEPNSSVFDEDDGSSEDNDDDDDDNIDNLNDDENKETKKDELSGDESDETEDGAEDEGRSRSLSIEECCMNGIDVGTKVAAEGFDGCFKMADRFNSYFTKWNRQCDRHFVVCCMRVVDGLSSKKGPSL